MGVGLVEEGGCTEAGEFLVLVPVERVGGESPKPKDHGEKVVIMVLTFLMAGGVTTPKRSCSTGHLNFLGLVMLRGLMSEFGGILGGCTA